MPSRRRQLVFLLPLFAAFVVMALSASASLFPAQAEPGKKKLSLRQWKKKMNGWSREIGKKCKYCHVKDGEEFDYKADTPKKTIADYCREDFVEKLLTLKKKPVTCGTCHNKKITFLPREEEGGETGSGGGEEKKAE